jgi:hypothetical protein
MLFSVAVGTHAVLHSHFRIDDFAHFLQSTQMSLFDFASTPIDIHFAPLHRLVTGLMYAKVPMNFALAVALLVTLQIGVLLVVDRLLERLAPSPWNGLLLAIVGANVYLIVPVSYWTSGLHRIPFVLSSAVCVLAYLRFRDEGKFRDQALALGACLFAMGFYSKAALLLPMLAAFELCLLRRPAAASVVQRGALFAAFTALMGAYPLLYASHPLGFEPLIPGANELPAILAHSFSVAAHTPFGLVATLESSYPVAVAAAWMGFATFTVYLHRFNGVVWLALLGVIALNITMIGLSQRANDLGAMIAYLYRYQFELALPLVVFAKLLLCNLAPLGIAARMPGWLTSPWWVPVVVAAYAAFNGVQANDLMRERYAVNQLAHDYTTTIFEQLPAVKPLMLIDGPVPRFMWVYDKRLRLLSNFLPVLGIDARYDVPSSELFRIEKDGSVRRVRRLDRQFFEFTELGSESSRSIRRLTGLSLDEAGCLEVNDSGGGVLELRLSELTNLYRGFVSVKYRAESAMTLRVAFWDGIRRRPEIGAGREFALPAGRGERLVDVSPPGLQPVRTHALEFTIPEEGLCLEAVRLVGYDFEPR